MNTERLDRIASDLESKGLLCEAAEIDAISNALDVAPIPRGRIDITPEQKKAAIEGSKDLLSDFKTGKVNDIEVYRQPDGNLEVTFKVAGDTVSTRKLAKYATSDDYEIGVDYIVRNNVRPQSLGL